MESNKNFNEKECQKASKACVLLYKWTMAINNYYKVFVTILPMKADLKNAQKELKEASESLKFKQEELRGVQGIILEYE